MPDGCGGELECGSCGDGETCGGGGEANVCGAGDPCTPTTCEAEGSNCGIISDGCGATVQCGTCAEGQTCGGGGEANVCGSADTCTPTTCEAAGANCGEVPDGCGGTLTCGSCGDGETCGGGGEANVCGAGDACVPTTCEAEEKTCGEIPDGCGGTLECGECGDGETCGAENVCVEPARVRWLETLGSGNVFTLAEDHRGGFVAIELSESFALGRYTRGGERTWRVGSPVDEDDSYVDVVVAPLGDSILATGAGPCPSCGGFIDEFSPSGEHTARRANYGGEIYRRELIADAAGGYAFLESDYDGPPVDSRLVHVAADGTRWTFGPVESVDGSGRQPGNFSELARGSDGNYVVAIEVYERVRIGELELGGDDGQTLALVKLSASGEPLWTHELRSDGFVADLGISDRGTAVILVANQSPTTWGGDTVDGGAALLTLERDGTERWARNLPGSALRGDALGVLGSGEAVVVTGTRTEAFVQRYALTGDRLWSHTIAIDDPDRDDLINVNGVAIVDGDAVLGGRFRGSASFGDGQKASGHDVMFLLNLGR